MPNATEEHKLISELAIQLNKAITIIANEHLTYQHADMGIPAMEAALEKAIAYGEKKTLNVAKSKKFIAEQFSLPFSE